MVVYFAREASGLSVGLCERYFYLCISINEMLFNPDTKIERLRSEQCSSAHSPIRQPPPLSMSRGRQLVTPLGLRVSVDGGDHLPFVGVAAPFALMQLNAVRISCRHYVGVTGKRFD
ncbi:hypothetical protein EVAR_57977_1 [Eumeta japonica]|uniref:Uncharacterized protein n=1 Tax=Eumeta variegata TaxID=151549 RepID=A0A4C1XXY9_EUMVA|nr:hypothetical protein EVAR_57977_1 [Eumeta japonica]